VTHPVQEQKEVITKTKWAKFRYVERQTKFITLLKTRVLKYLSRLSIPQVNYYLKIRTLIKPNLINVVFINEYVVSVTENRQKVYRTH
jgi:hypothetical protein